MTRRERVIAAVGHEDTGFIPYQCDFTTQEKKNMDVFVNGDFDADRYKFINSWYYDAFPKELPDKPEHYLDNFGVVWNRSGADKDIGIIEDALIDDIENISYPFPEIDEREIRHELEKLIASKGDRFALPGISYCLYERGWSLCKMENMLMYMISNPNEVEALYDKICGYYLKVLDVFLEYDIDGVIFGDDWGSQRGLIMGLAHWRRFIKPQIARMYKRVKEKGLIVIQHSCGDVFEIFPELIEIGLDVYQTFQPEIYDIEHVKKLYGKSLSFWGGISTQKLLPFAAPEQVKRETLRIMNIMGENGGYIASPTHAVPQDVPPENIIAMLDAFENQKMYI